MFIFKLTTEILQKVKFKVFSKGVKIGIESFLTARNLSLGLVV